MSNCDGPNHGSPGPPATNELGVTAVVLTFMRPRLAGNVIRSLRDVEGLSTDRLMVVVNGVGGLDDPQLEASVRMVRLPENTGPAGGFLEGMRAAFEDPTTQWVYLCEDDVGLFDLPSPRVGAVLARVATGDHGTAPVGAVVAYGRRFIGRGAHTVNLVPAGDMEPVDVASWGATLVSRAVYEAGVLPDPTWFFGLEDFDFFCRVRAAGFQVLVDGQAARSVGTQQTSIGRDEAIRAERPGDADEVWRSYYHARNSIELARRHGHPTWYAWHLAYSARHLQKAHGAAERRAILHGLWDGARGRMGQNPRYARRVGEFDAPSPGDSARAK